MTPRHTSTYLRLYAYRYVGTKKVQTLSFPVKVTNANQAADTTKYTASVKLTKKGTWKLRVKHSAHGDEWTTYSGYSAKITVK